VVKGDGVVYGEKGGEGEDRDFIAHFASNGFSILRVELETNSGMSNNVIPERSHPPKPLVPLASKSKESSVCPIGNDAVQIENEENYLNNVRQTASKRIMSITTSSLMRKKKN
jgi:hypothetical protein